MVPSLTSSIHSSAGSGPSGFASTSLSTTRSFAARVVKAMTALAASPLDDGRRARPRRRSRGPSHPRPRPRPVAAKPRCAGRSPPSLQSVGASGARSTTRSSSMRAQPGPHATSLPRSSLAPSPALRQHQRRGVERDGPESQRRHHRRLRGVGQARIQADARVAARARRLRARSRSASVPARATRGSGRRPPAARCRRRPRSLRRARPPGETRAEAGVARG